MLLRYEAPEVADFGSIAEHTFTVCNPQGARPDTPGGNIPPKGPLSPTTHFDKFNECSETGVGLTL